MGSWVILASPEWSTVFCTPIVLSLHMPSVKAQEIIPPNSFYEEGKPGRGEDKGLAMSLEILFTIWVHTHKYISSYSAKKMNRDHFSILHIFLFGRKHDIFLYHIWVWELDHEEVWAPKNWCVVLEKALESLLDSEEIKLVSPKRNQPWIFIWRDWCWSWSCSTLAAWCEEMTLWKRPWCWVSLKAKGEEGRRG